MVAANYRVLCDWDKNGWLNAGVDETTPRNLVPDSIWGMSATGRFDWTVAETVLVSTPKKYLPTDYGLAVTQGNGNLSTDLLMGLKQFYPNQVVDTTRAHNQLAGSSKLDYVTRKLRRGLYDYRGDIHTVLGTGKITVNTTSYIGYDGTTYAPIMLVTAGTTYKVRLWSSRSREYTGTSYGSYVLSILTQTGTVVTSSPGTGLAFPTVTDLTFTAPVGMTGLVLRMVTTPPLGGVEGIYWGLQVVTDLVSTLSTKFPDPAITFSPEQFDLVLEAGTTYNLSFWVRDIPEVSSTTFGTNNIIYGGIINSYLYYPISSNAEAARTINQWTKYTYTIAPQLQKFGLFFDVGGSSLTRSQVAGVQVTQSTDSVPFNTGHSYAHYEDITQYVEQVTWRLGKNEFEDALPFEGEAQITLNNSSRLFSPSNADSPLHRLMDKNLRVVIQTRWDEFADWDTRWTGWTDTYEVDPGEFGQQKTLIRAVQGVGRMREGKLWFLREENGELAETVQNMINESGWISSDAIPTSLVGYETLLDVNAYVSDPDEGWNVIQDGVAPIEFIGFDWNETTSVQEAITDLLNSQNAQVYIERDGRVSLYNRENFINGWLEYDEEIDLNTYPDVTYQYGEDIVNSITVTIQRKKEDNGGVLWETKRAIKVFPKGTRDFAVNYQFAEGQPKTPVEAGSTEVDVYFSDPGLSGIVVPEPTSSELDANAFVEVLTDGANRTTLRLTNKFNKPVWFDVVLNGSAVERGDKEAQVVEDEEAIKDLNEVRKSTFSNPIISDIESARSAAWAIMARRSLPGGEFSGFGFYIEDEDSYDLMNSLSIAKKVIASEYQTGEVDLPHLIVEESGTIVSGGLMKVAYSVARLDPNRYLYADADLETPYDNLISDFEFSSIFDSVMTPVSDNYTELASGTWGGDYYLGVDLLDMSFPYRWSSDATGSVQSKKVATLGGDMVESNYIHRYTTVEFEKKYLWHTWLYAGTDVTGYIDSSADAWGGGIPTPATLSSTVPIVQLMRDNQLQGDTPHFTLKVSRLYFGGNDSPGYLMMHEAVPDQIILDPAKTYTVAMYARPAGGFTPEDYTLEVFDTTGLVIDSATDNFNSGDIDTLSITFTGVSAAFFRIKYSNVGIMHKLNLYGFKLVEGSVAPAEYADVPNPLAYDIYT